VGFSKTFQQDSGEQIASINLGNSLSGRSGKILGQAGALFDSRGNLIPQQKPQRQLSERERIFEQNQNIARQRIQEQTTKENVQNRIIGKHANARRNIVLSRLGFDPKTFNIESLKDEDGGKIQALINEGEQKLNNQ
jgi:hypothetical protein